MHNNEKQGVTGEEAAGQSVITEMMIVDTFTRLIFEQDADLCARDAQIIEAFRVAEHQVRTRDTVGLGDYLRDLGVREMIKLVGRVRDVLALALPGLASADAEQARDGHTPRITH
jgi:hypothetical protein